MTGSRCCSLMQSMCSSPAERPVNSVLMKVEVKAMQALKAETATLGTYDWEAMRPDQRFLLE